MRAHDFTLIGVSAAGRNHDRIICLSARCARLAIGIFIVDSMHSSGTIMTTILPLILSWTNQYPSNFVEILIVGAVAAHARKLREDNFLASRAGTQPTSQTLQGCPSLRRGRSCCKPRRYSSAPPSCSERNMPLEAAGSRGSCGELRAHARRSLPPRAFGRGIWRLSWAAPRSCSDLLF